jgi:hypothetical protein
LWAATPTATVKLTNNVATINWQKDGAGTVQVIQKDNVFLCEATATLNVQITKSTDPGTTTGLEDRHDSFVYPNPADGKVHFQLSEEVKSIKIFDSVGKELRIEGVNEDLLATYDLSSMPAGAYFYRVVLNSGHQVTGKIIRK